MSLSWIKSQFDFDVAMRERLRDMWEDIVRSSMNVSDDELFFFEVIGSWADEWRVKVLVEREDIAMIWSSTCEDDSNRNEFEFVRSKETEISEEIELIDITLSSTSDKFWVCTRRRAIICFETEDVVWVTIDEEQSADMIRTLSLLWSTSIESLAKTALILTFRTSLKRFIRTSKSRWRISSIRMRHSVNVHL